MVPPPLQPPKESVGLRYKLVWRLLIISNLALGAYMFATPRRKSMGNEEAGSKAGSKARSTLTANSSPPLPVDVDLPIPQNQQQELLNNNSAAGSPKLPWQYGTTRVYSRTLLAVEAKVLLIDKMPVPH
ncbi:hypothetical protein POM88_040847 [Heracleum sosnowskyi]|uniref:Uncharacterized protein n=1 Tax=Heracleum sosnowskyi TaxID=360622 RepID=A0AAD8HDW9_9APIA|nr:hypothetical protein POM88_040847 [Heracleum sosnowskyi]